MVVLSDVWLDKPETLDRLRTLFAGDDQCDMERCSMRTVPKSSRVHDGFTPAAPLCHGSCLTCA